MDSNLFYSFEGDLYSKKDHRLVRRDYDKGFHQISNTRQLCSTLRAGEFAWPGGYQMYFITADGGALSFDSVRKELYAVLRSIYTGSRGDGWCVEACEINYEDGELVCDHSGERIPSAYAG